MWVKETGTFLIHWFFFVWTLRLLRRLYRSTWYFALLSVFRAFVCLKFVSVRNPNFWYTLLNHFATYFICEFLLIIILNHWLGQFYIWLLLRLYSIFNVFTTCVWVWPNLAYINAYFDWMSNLWVTNEAIAWHCMIKAKSDTVLAKLLMELIS